MSTTLTKEELVRANWLVELRRQGHRQCVGAWDRDGKVCALQLLSDQLGVVGHVKAAQLAGLSRSQMNDVANLNDGVSFDPALARFHIARVHTFAEIADIVEGWFQTP